VSREKLFYLRFICPFLGVQHQEDIFPLEYICNLLYDCACLKQSLVVYFTTKSAAQATQRRMTGG